jgi:hypothetical protein
MRVLRDLKGSQVGITVLAKVTCETSIMFPKRAIGPHRPTIVETFQIFPHEQETKEDATSVPYIEFA